jgi:HD-like signal output (HDOD) protein
LLAKPCDVSVLCEALQKTSVLHQILADDAIRRVVARIDTLPSMPANCADIMDELQSEDASIQRVANLIAQDLGMTAKILQMVNSAFFGLFRRVADVQDAVMLLGLDAIKALVLSINVFSAFNTRRIPFFDIEGLWQHSLVTGGYARQIMTLIARDRNQATAAFLSGMLHDIGKLILAINFRDAYRSLIRETATSAIDRLAREREAIGTTHAEVGAYLMGLWGLESPILTAIAFHHAPLESPIQTIAPLTAVHLANGFEHRRRQSPNGGCPAAEEFDRSYMDRLSLAAHIEDWRQACADLEEGRS